MLNISVKQTQKIDKDAPCFAFTLVLRRGPRERQGVEAHAPGREAGARPFAIPCPERPRFVVVDPEFAVLADVKLEAPSTCSSVSSPTRRPHAVAGSRPSRSASGATHPRSPRSGGALARETEFWGVRAEAAQRSVARASPKLRDLEDQGQDQAPQGAARGRAGARAISARPKPPKRSKAIALEDPSYLVEIGGRAIARSDAAGHRVRHADRDPGSPLVGRRHPRGRPRRLGALRDDRAITHVLARTKYGVDSRGRRAAIMALAKLTTDANTAKPSKSCSTTGTLTCASTSCARSPKWATPRRAAALARHLELEQDGRVRRRIREALQELGARSKERDTECEDELDKLKTEHAELSAKVKKLEAALPKKK